MTIKPISSVISYAIIIKTTQQRRTSCDVIEYIAGSFHTTPGPKGGDGAPNCQSRRWWRERVRAVRGPRLLLPLNRPNNNYRWALIRSMYCFRCGYQTAQNPNTTTQHTSRWRQHQHRHSPRRRRRMHATVENILLPELDGTVRDPTAYISRAHTLVQ